MPQGPDFPDIDSTIQVQTLTFDYGNLVAPGVALSMPVVTIALVSGDDPDPGSRLIGVPTIGVASRPKGSGGPAVLQQIANCVAGARYLLVSKASASPGSDEPSLWSHIKCVEPQ